MFSTHKHWDPLLEHREWRYKEEETNMESSSWTLFSSRISISFLIIQSFSMVSWRVFWILRPDKISYRLRNFCYYGTGTIHAQSKESFYISIESFKSSDVWNTISWTDLNIIFWTSLQLQKWLNSLMERMFFMPLVTTFWAVFGTMIHQTEYRYSFVDDF